MSVYSLVKVRDIYISQFQHEWCSAFSICSIFLSRCRLAPQCPFPVALVKYVSAVKFFLQDEILEKDRGDPNSHLCFRKQLWDYGGSSSESDGTLYVLHMFGS